MPEKAVSKQQPRPAPAKTEARPVSPPGDAHQHLLTREGVIQLQRLAGNAAVGRALAPPCRPPVQRQPEGDPNKGRLSTALMGVLKLEDRAAKAGVGEPDNINTSNSLAGRLFKLRMNILTGLDEAHPDDTTTEELLHRQQLLTSEVAEHEKLQATGAGGTGRAKQWAKKTGKALGSTVIGLGKSALKAAFGPLYRVALLILSAKERKKFKEDMSKYINVLRKEGDLRGGNTGMNWLYGALGFVANTILGEVAALAGWMMLLTGLVGLIPGAQAALGLATIFGSIATLAALGKAGLNGVLAVWSGIRVALEYRRLPEDLTTPDGRKHRDRYLASLAELGENVKNTVAGARDVGVVALTGGLGAVATGGDFAAGMNTKVSEYYKPAFDGASFRGAAGQANDRWQSSDEKYAGMSDAERKTTMIEEGRSGVIGTGKMKDDVAAAAYVEGLDKERTSKNDVYLHKRDLPKWGPTVGKAVLDGIGPVKRIVGIFKHMREGVKLIKTGIDWVVNKVKGAIKGPQDAADRADEDVQQAGGVLGATDDALDNINDVVST